MEIHRTNIVIKDYPELDNVQQVALETLIQYYNNHHAGRGAIQEHLSTLGVKHEVELELENESI